MQVTQYSCKFCNRRFDSIDKVKNHYLQRHNDTVVQSQAKPSAPTTRSVKRENESPQTTPAKRQTTATTPVRNYKIEIVGDIDEEDILSSASGANKKRGRRSAGVKRKYPCDWPACNYVARHSVNHLVNGLIRLILVVSQVHLKDHKRTHTGEKPYRLEL